MLERYVKNVRWQTIARGLKPVARIWSISPGGWIVLMVLVLFGGLVSREHLNRDARRREIASAYGAANTFLGPAQLSHDGTRLLYVATTETRSCALYLYDINRQQTRELFVEHDGLGESGDDFELRSWGWSPDDKMCLYAVRDKLVVCPVDGPGNPEELVVGIRTVSEVAWLAPNRFAFISGKRNLSLAWKTDDGKWQQSTVPLREEISHLAAINSNTVAWLQDGDVCHLDVDQYHSETAEKKQSHLSVSPNLTISWVQDAWGFDRAVPYRNMDQPIPDTWAGILLSSNWNDTWAENAAFVHYNGVTVNQLYDNTGKRTTAGITYAAYNGASLVDYRKGADADGTCNREMLNGFLNAGPASWGTPITNSSVAIRDIPFGTYDVIVYFGSDVSRRRGRITGGSTSFYFSTMGQASVNGDNALFSPTMQTDATLFPEANFAFFPGQTNSTYTLTCYPLDRDQWLGISAVQIIQSSNVFLAGEIIPKNQTVKEGASVNFKVMAGGLAPHFQWRHDGTNVAGATNAFYSIGSVRLEDAGDYEVLVANQFNSITSRVAKLSCLKDESTSRIVFAKTKAKTGAQPQAGISTNGLVLWLDASTLQQGNQTPIHRINDQSICRNDVVIDGHAPLFNSPESPGGLNGRGTVQFSSFGSVENASGLKTVRTLGITGNAPRTVIAVMRRDPKRSMFVSLGNCGIKGEYCGICDVDWAIYLPAGMVTDNVLPPVKPQWNILSMVYDGTSQRGYVNGIFRGASTFSMNTPDAEVELGVRRAEGGDAGQSAASDGDLAELLIFNRALEPTEQQQIESYLLQKWFNGRSPDIANPFHWITLTTNRITEFAYSVARQESLLSSVTGPTTTVWRCDSDGVLTEAAKDSSAKDIKWISPRQFAWLRSSGGRQQIAVSELSAEGRNQLLSGSDVEWFAPDDAGGRLLFFGVASNEPASSLWLFDLVSQRLRPLVAYSDHVSGKAKKIVPFEAPCGETGCLVFPPLKIERHKKYPLIITDTSAANIAHGPMFNSALAGCDAFVAIVERKRGWFEDIEGWETNVLNIYQKLKQDPAVDSGRVYLYATSAETRYMSDLVEKTPGLWRGLILLNPGQLPDFSKSPHFQSRPKILLSAGELEREADRFKQYQKNALNWGVMVEYVIAPGEPHRMVGKTAKLERARAVEHFIFEE